MTIKPIKQWRRALLDTTVIMDFVKDPEKFAKNPPEQLRIINTKDLLVYSSPAAPPSENEPPKVTLLISAVSISELLSMPGSCSNIQKIVSLFSGSNVEVLDYSGRIASNLVDKLSDFLPHTQWHQLSKKLESDLKSNGISWARQWISDDLKILATALAERKLDAVVSADKGVFKTIAGKMGLPYVNTEELPTNLLGEIDVDTSLKSIQ